MDCAWITHRRFAVLNRKDTGGGALLGAFNRSADRGQGELRMIAARAVKFAPAAEHSIDLRCQGCPPPSGCSAAR